MWLCRKISIGTRPRLLHFYIYIYQYIIYIDTYIHLYSKDQKNTQMIACLACYHRKARNKALHLRITTRNPLQLIINSMKRNKLHAIPRPAPLTRSMSHCCAVQRRLQVRKRCRLRKCESQRVTHCGRLLPSFTVHASALLQPCVTNAAGPALLAFDIGGLIEYSDEPEVSMYTRQAPRRRMTCGRVVLGVRRVVETRVPFLIRDFVFLN